MFVASYFNENTYKGELSVDVVPGRYILAVFHEWFLSNHGKYFVFLASEKQINLQKGGVVDNNFLLKSISSYEMQQADSELAANKLYKMRLEIEKLGLSWLVLKPNASKTKNIKVDINHEYFFIHLVCSMKKVGKFLNRIKTFPPSTSLKKPNQRNQWSS